jgi:hypothetical protein
VEFTSVELAGSTEIVTPVEKAMAGHFGGERGLGGRPTGRRSWHKPPLKRDRSDQAGTMQNESRTMDDECRCFVDRPINLAPCCSRESMVALETQGIILVRDKALCPMWRCTSSCSSVQVLQKAYNGGCVS